MSPPRNSADIQINQVKKIEAKEEPVVELKKSITPVPVIAAVAQSKESESPKKSWSARHPYASTALLVLGLIFFTIPVLIGLGIYKCCKKKDEEEVKQPLLGSKDSDVNFGSMGGSYANTIGSVIPISPPTKVETLSPPDHSNSNAPTQTNSSAPSYTARYNRSV